jgi:hypothetical protein
LLCAAAARRCSQRQQEAINQPSKAKADINTAMERLLSGLRHARPEVKPADCVARYVVVKHSWRGKYKRVLCITPTAVHTQNPEAHLAITNTFTFGAVRFLFGAEVGGREARRQPHQPEKQTYQ